MNHTILPPDLLKALDSILLGKAAQLRLALACLLARGHLLIEDVPGVGKTTLALALARVLGLDYQRIQFTSDLLPSDVLGVSVYRREQADFEFRPGPVFAQLVLADELNRASARTQSALLEAMEERQVTVDGITRALPDPFFVVATLNPTEQLGTFALPESQLDRFLMRISLGYPDTADELALLAATDRRSAIAGLPPLLDAARLLDLQRQAAAVHTTTALLNYILALVQESRARVEIRHGLSPRAGIALRRAAQALAFIEGRSGAIPEDVQRAFIAVAAHRLVARNAGTTGRELAEQLLGTVAIP